MATFRFRAQAALDLRARELESAQRDLARAQQDQDAAAARLAHAEEACAGARRDSTRIAQASATVNELERYRFWIIRLDHERHDCTGILATRAATVAKAVEGCRAALRRCKSLERLRDASRLRHQAGEAADERKVIDELATRRFAAQSSGRTRP